MTAGSEGGPLFSVLMACYNRADLVHEAVDSILASTFTDFELVCVDDGSTDGTPEVLRGYADPRVRVLVNDRNRGRSVTRSRAVEAARGRYVVWMADDDLLVADTLEVYAREIAQHPEIDVFYGNLVLFEDGVDLKPYEPNDWTGRSDRLLGAKLIGSCVPDLGSCTRRTIYEQVGLYDPEFVRAQDYELWTRIVPVAEFRKVDRVVAKYRKHERGVSWGRTVDLSYDSKIIRRLLGRHPLPDFFLDEDWSQPVVARWMAYGRIARNLLLYKDAYNAAAFVAAIPRHELVDPWLGVAFEAATLAGHHDRAGALLARAEAARVRPSAKLRELQAQLEARRRRAALIEAALASDPESAAPEIDAWLGAWELDLVGAYALARLLRARGRPEEALPLACYAARVDPLREDTLALAEALRAEVGSKSPHTDAATQRARLTEAIYPIEVEDFPLPIAGPPLTVLACTREPAARAGLARQTYPVRAVVEVTDRNAALTAVGEGLVAWLTDGAVWHDHHLSALVGRLGEAGVVCGETLRTRVEDGVVTASYLVQPPKVDLDHLLARDLAPLSSVVHEAGLGARFREGVHAEWEYVVDLAAEAQLAHQYAVTGEAPVTPEPGADDVVALRAIQGVYARHGRAATFASRARAEQNAVLDRFGVALAPRGRSNVVVLATDLAATRGCLDAVRAHTHVPYDIVVVADPAHDASEAFLEWLRALRADDGVNLKWSRRPLDRAKRLNVGLGEANGELVALLDARARPADGWLGRLQWWANQAPQTGLVAPRALDGRCLLLTRGLLDRAGGFDATLRGYPLADLLLRARVAGFEALVVDDVGIDGEPPPEEGSAERFVARWGFTPPADLANLPVLDVAYDRGAHYVPFGSEEGFRPDARPLEVIEAGARNVLVAGLPWAEPDALAEWLGAIAERRVTFWLRAAPGEGPRAGAALEAAARIIGVEPADLPQLLVVDARLAPDREAALYVTADAVYVEDAWPDADLHARRGSDCGRPVLRGPEELRGFDEGG